MNKMKKSRKLLVVLLALSMIIAVFPLTAFAGVTDTGDGSIIRTTTTNYYTTVKIEGTFIAAGATTPETFTDSSAEITGNTGDADVQTEINRLKEAFRNWAGEKNATEINFDNEAVSHAYYEVHDEIVNSKDNIVTVTICTVLDKHQIYTITASAKQNDTTQPVYKFIEGANSSWMQNDDGTLTFRANGDFDKFTGVKVDGSLIDEKYYSAVSGSTIVTLKNDYLKTLAVGTHLLTVVYTDGDCSTNFEIKSTQNPVIPEQTSNTQPTSPQTGDNSHMSLWVALLFISGSCLVGITVYRRKKNYNAD